MMNKKLFCLMSGFVLFITSIITPVCLAGDRSDLNDQKKIELLNDALVTRNVFAVPNVLGIELSDDEIPKKFFVTSYGFFSEARRILNFIDLLETHRDQKICMQTIGQINEIFGLQFSQFVMHHKKIDQAAKLQILGIIEKLRTTISLGNAEFARMVVGLFQVRVGNWSYENKLGMMAVVLERARNGFLAASLSRDELGMFIGQLEEIFIKKLREIQWKTIGKVFLITTVLAGLGYAGYKVYSWSKNKMVPAVEGLGNNIRRGSENIKDGAVDVLKNGIIEAVKDLKATIPATVEESAKKACEVIEAKLKQAKKNVEEEAGSTFWKATGNVATYPLKKAFSGVKYYAYDKWVGDDKYNDEYFDDLYGSE